jgi:hypothetical protein
VILQRWRENIIAEPGRAGFVIVPRLPDKERPNGNYAD